MLPGIFSKRESAAARHHMHQPTITYIARAQKPKERHERRTKLNVASLSLSLSPWAQYEAFKFVNQKLQNHSSHNQPKNLSSLVIMGRPKKPYVKPGTAPAKAVPKAVKIKGHFSNQRSAPDEDSLEMIMDAKTNEDDDDEDEGDDEVFDLDGDEDDDDEDDEVCCT